MRRIFQMPENVRGLVTDQVLSNTCGKMQTTSITASTYKLVNHTWTEPIRDRVFHTKQVTDSGGRENQFDIQVIAIALNKIAIAEKWPMLDKKQPDYSFEQLNKLQQRQQRKKQQLQHKHGHQNGCGYTQDHMQKKIREEERKSHSVGGG